MERITKMRNEDFILLHFLKFALSASPAADFDKESANRTQLRFVSDFFKKYDIDIDWAHLIRTAGNHGVLSCCMIRLPPSISAIRCRYRKSRKTYAASKGKKHADCPAKLQAVILQQSFNYALEEAGISVLL